MAKHPNWDNSSDFNDRVAATAVLAAHWLAFVALDPSFWTNALYAVPPIAAAVLTIVGAIAERRAKPANFGRMT